MKTYLSILFFFSHSLLMSSSDLEINENIIFQKNSISQNNIISEISSQREFLKLIENAEFNDNFFYALFDPITNNNIFPHYSSDIDFFFEKTLYILSTLLRFQFFCFPATWVFINFFCLIFPII